MSPKLSKLQQLLPLLVFLITTTLASTLNPPVLPLAVRNPYLSLWYNSRLAPFEDWPQFWTGSHIGVGILARVASTKNVYPLLGRPQDALDPESSAYNISLPEFLGHQYTADATSLKYRLEGGTVDVELLWTSPITGEDIRRQSIPASYLEIKVNGTSLDVDIYVDVNGSGFTFPCCEGWC